MFKVVTLANTCTLNNSEQLNKLQFASILATIHYQNIMSEYSMEQLMEELSSQRKKPLTNAEKQKRYRERQKLKGKKELRGYLTPEAIKCYQQIAEQTGWTDSVIISNALRITYAAYKNGQIGLLNRWLTSKKL
jgi:hypothetical protein